MSSRTSTWAALLFLALTVSCTSPASEDPTTSSPTPDGQATGSALATAPPLTALAPFSTSRSQPWPADLTEDHNTAADEALSVYRAYWALSHEARTRPGDDWSAQFSQVAAGIVYDAVVGLLSGAAAKGEHWTGTTRIAPEVIKAAPALVTITDCLDNTDTDHLAADGTSIKDPDAPDSGARHVAIAEVGQFQDGRWLVVSINQDRTTTC